MTTNAELNESLDSLGKTALEVKKQRDMLLMAAQMVYQELDDRYDVDQPEPGVYKESPFNGAGACLSALRNAIERCGEKV